MESFASHQINMRSHQSKTSIQERAQRSLAAVAVFWDGLEINIYRIMKLDHPIERLYLQTDNPIAQSRNRSYKVIANKI